MPIFPEHIHLDSEDALLRHVERDRRYRFLLDGYLFALITGGALFVIAVVALMLM
jgi:hypothetical protein